ncbi:tyrosine-protein phosphatase [Microbacterium halotolerans]|uniref:tyrosine-protein phosphatase n=1 Tax=Microbacterium halotolerans TaxID=246613 RepID=UPI000E6A95A4|nr:tyrosine-protein phosphatase [Microbacterium halotolerans]
MTETMQRVRLHNLRDIGGIRIGGGRFADAVLYRSAAPLRDDPSIAAAVHDLGVRSIVDLRDQQERSMSPDVWGAADLRVEHLPVFQDRLRSIRFQTLDELYDIMLGDFAPSVAAAVGAVLTRVSEGPTLVHCTAGKDRTGVVIGIVLDLLGADRADVLSDYELSQSSLGRDYLRDLFGVAGPDDLPGGAAHRATSAPRALLAGALARVSDEFGGAEAFLLAHGVPQPTLDASRLLIERTSAIGT